MSAPPATLPRDAVMEVAPLRNRTVLVIDDDPDIRLVLEIALEDAGCEVIPAATGEQGLLTANEANIDLALVDLRLPGLPGLEILPTLRATSPRPLFVITAQTAGPETTQSLRRGADDYLTKPFSTRDLVRRIRAQLSVDRWPPSPCGGRLAVGDDGELELDGQPLLLTVTERHLLAHLVRAGGRAVTPTELLAEVWGYRGPGDHAVVTCMVDRVRAKLGDTATPRILLGSPDPGYRVLPTGC